jgi:hypothetical protein
MSMQIYRDIWEFFWSVANNWAGYFTGGLIIALVSFYYAWRNQTMARKIILIFSIIFFLMACFKAWKDEKEKADSVLQEEKRPIFSLIAPGIKQIPNSSKFRMQIGMENTGFHRALDLEGMVILIDQRFNTEPGIVPFSVAGEIPPHSPTPWYSDPTRIPPNASPMYIVYAIKYIDAQARGIKYSQVMYMKWSGAQNGEAESDFVSVSNNERDYILSHMRALIEKFTK